MTEKLSQFKGSEHFVEKEFPPDLFENRDVVVLGETAHGEHTETILNFMENFGSQINEVLIEPPVDYQDSVNNYIATGKVNDKLENLFIGAEKEGKDVRDLLKIFDEAKKLNKEIRCFDSSKTKNEEYQNASKYGHYFLKGKSRDEDMFVNFQRQYKELPGKYLLIVGANHAQEGKHPETDDETLGERLKKTFGEKYASFEMITKIK